MPRGLQKGSKKYRVNYFFQKKYKPALIAEITGISRQLVNIYIWQIRNAEKCLENERKRAACPIRSKKRKEYRQRYYQENKEWMGELSREYYYSVTKPKRVYGEQGT